MENFHLQNTDIKKIICDLGAHCLNRIPFIFWPVHLNNRIHLQTEIAVCLPSVKYKCSSKEKTSCSIPVSNSEQTSQLFFLLLEAHYQAQARPTRENPASEPSPSAPAKALLLLVSLTCGEIHQTAEQKGSLQREI